MKELQPLDNLNGDFALKLLRANSALGEKRVQAAHRRELKDEQVAMHCQQLHQGRVRQAGEDGGLLAQKAVRRDLCSAAHEHFDGTGGVPAKGGQVLAQQFGESGRGLTDKCRDTQIRSRRGQEGTEVSERVGIGPLRACNWR